MKNSKKFLRDLLFLLVTLCPFLRVAAFDAVLNDESGRKRLSDVLFLTIGKQLSVNENNFNDVYQLLNEDIIKIYNERFNAAKSRGMYNLNQDQLRALVRAMFLELNANKNLSNEAGKDVLQFCKDKWESDRIVIGQISAWINDPLNSPHLYGWYKPTNEKADQNVEIKKKLMASWMGHHKSELIRSWGAPARTASDGNGGEILIYEDLPIRLGGSATTTSSSDFGFGQTFNTTFGNPRTFISSTEIFADQNGVIYHWKPGLREQ